MQQASRKVKRVQPLIHMKKVRVDEESAVLVRIRAEKVELVRAMRENQRRYMEEVDRLNQVRASRDRANLTTLEGGLDHIKDQWWRLYKQVQEVERRESAQMEALLAAERDLSTIERLKERYEAEFQQAAKNIDRKILDDFAIRNHRQDS